MDITRIIAVRHGETDWNLATRIQGKIDIPLNANGRWQAQRLARTLAALDPLTAIYTSDLSRARETAQATSDATGLALCLEPALRERGFGHFEGHTFVEAEEAWPRETARWRERDPDWAPRGGETLSAVRERVLRATDALASRHRGEQILLVAHGGVIDALYRAATGLDIRSPRTWPLGNASINRLLWTPQGLSLVGWSDTAHLEREGQDEATA